MADFTQSDWYGALYKHSTAKTLLAGEAISFEQNSPSDGPRSEDVVGIILSGHAHALSYSENGEETWLGEHRPGQFIGLMPLLSHGHVKFDIRAEEDMVLRVISQARMRSLLSEHAALGTYIAQDFASRLDDALLSLIDTHTLSVKGRICIELLRLSVPIGLEPDKQIIRPSPVFVDLARRINSTRETVSRTVNELKRMGVISREPGALVIQNPQQLKNTFQ